MYIRMNIWNYISFVMNIILMQNQSNIGKLKY
jgi:hypothetical protein